MITINNDKNRIPRMRTVHEAAQALKQLDAEYRGDGVPYPQAGARRSFAEDQGGKEVPDQPRQAAGVSR